MLFFPFLGFALFLEYDFQLRKKFFKRETTKQTKKLKFLFSMLKIFKSCKNIRRLFFSLSFRRNYN